MIKTRPSSSSLLLFSLAPSAMLGIGLGCGDGGGGGPGGPPWPPTVLPCASMSAGLDKWTQEGAPWKLSKQLGCKELTVGVAELSAANPQATLWIGESNPLLDLSGLPIALTVEVGVTGSGGAVNALAAIDEKNGDGSWHQVSGQTGTQLRAVAGESAKEFLTATGRSDQSTIRYRLNFRQVPDPMKTTTVTVRIADIEQHVGGN